MATQAELELVISMRDRAQAQIKGLERQLAGLGRTVQTLGRAFNGGGGFLGGAGLAAAATSVIGIGLAFDSTEEQARLAFETILGSGAKAQDMIERVKRVALETPFAFTDVLRSSQRLLAAGFDPNQVDQTMATIADAISSTGDISRDKLDQMTGAFARMRMTGTFSMEAISELGASGVNVLHLLAEQAGTSDFAMSRMLERMSGRLPAGPMMERIFGVLNAKYGGLAKKQADTMQGVLNNIKDLLQQRLGAIMLPIFIRTEQLLRRIFYYLDQVRDVFKGLPKPVQDFVRAISPLLLIAVPLGLAFGVVTAAISGWLAVLAPVAGAIGAVALVLEPFLPIIALVAIAVATLYFAWSQNWFGIQQITYDAVNWIMGALSTFAGWISAFLANPLGAVVALFQWMGSTAGAIVLAAWNYLIALAQWVGGAVLAVLIFALDGWLAVFGTNTADVVATIAAAWPQIVAWCIWLVTETINLISVGWQAVVDSFNWLKSTAVGIVSAVATEVVSWWNWMIGVIAASPIGSAIGAVGGIIGGALHAIGVPGFAEGGIVTGRTLAMVGEAGPEAIIPLSKLGRGGGASYTININGPVYANDIEDMVVRALDAATRKGRAS